MTPPCDIPVNAERSEHIRKGVLFFILLVLLINLGFFAQMSATILQYPYSIDEVEGSTWASVDWMDEIGAYPDYLQHPYIPTSYPPLFYVATRAMGVVAGNTMLAGRLVSLLATLATALVVGLFVRRWTQDRMLALIGGLLFLAGNTPFAWGMLYRVDALATLLTALGLFFALSPGLTRRRIIVAALFFLAAWFTKQTALFGACTAAVYLLWASFTHRDDRQHPSPAFVIVVIAATMLAAGALIGILQATTHGRYWMNAFGLMSNLTHFSWQPGAMLTQDFFLLYTPLIFAVAFFLIIEQRRIRHEAPALLFLGGGLLFVIACLPMMLFRVGSNTNYFVRPHLLLVLLAPIGIAWCRRKWARMSMVTAPFLFVLITLPFPGNPINGWSYVPWQMSAVLEEDRAVKDAVAERICAEEGEVLSDDLSIPLSCGKRAIFEPFLMDELRRRGFWDPKPFVADVTDGRYRLAAYSGRFHYVPFVRDALTTRYKPIFMAQTPKPVWDITQWKVLEWKQP